METRKISIPIAMAKPIRGREMQSTVIPKDVVETVRAVSAKQIRGDSIVENLQKPREGDVEVYHEGYADGKLYLVPDTNLKAMRDIVNLKMRRRHSSAEKPQTSLDEPTQCTEFKSKLDCLLEKIDQLADSSCDETKSPEGSVNSKKTMKKRDLRKKTEQTKTNHQTSNLSILKKGNENNVIKSELLSMGKTSEKRVIIPPMLDNRISYIRVNRKDSKKSGNQFKDSYSFGSQQEPIKDRDMRNLQTKLEELSEEQNLDKFKLLISGHLQNGVAPTFIVHQNYAGLNVLETDPPDFKTHKKEGNIDIFITGKFFTGSILKEESSEEPAVLDLKSNKIVIDKKKDVQRKKFKDIYKVGPLEVALEGEFKKDSKTLKYTPVFSLSIIKSSYSVLSVFDFEKMLLENKSNTKPPTHVLYSEQNHHTPFRHDKDGSMTGKHVHYASGNREPSDEMNSKRKSATNKGILSSLKKNMIYRKIFSKANHTQSDGSLNSEAVSSSSLQVRGRSSRIKREELARLRKSRLRESRGKFKKKRGEFKKLSKILEGSSSYTSNPDIPSKQLLKNKHEAISAFEVQSSLPSSDKILHDISERNVDTKKVKMVKKKKKTDKNQAIVENPILAQMQEFFIA